MESAFILQHSYEIDGYDETKFIGIYSTKSEAKLAISRLNTQPGFRDRPDKFYIDEYEFNKDNWTEGYATMTSIQVPDKNGNWMTVSADVLIDGTYQIIETYQIDLLGKFKHLDIVKCEERGGDVFAIKLIKKAPNIV